LGKARERKGSPRRRSLEHGLALVLTCLATWPLILELPFATRLSDPGLDDYIYYWNDIWVFRALFELGESPLHCSQVFHPQGTSLALSPLAMPLAVLSLPFQAWLVPLHGAAVATKLFLFASFPLAILGMARFLRRVFDVPPWIAFLGGCLFAFVPFRMLHLGRVHYLLGALAPWFLERLAAAVRPVLGRPPLGRALGAGAFLALAGACDASLLPELGFAGLALLVYLQRELAIDLKYLAQRTALAYGSGLVFLAPLLVPMLLELRSNPGTDVVAELRFERNPTPIQLRFSPDLNNLLWYASPALHETFFGPGSGLAEGSQENRLIYGLMHGNAPVTTREAVAAGGALLGVLVLVGLGTRRRLWPFAALAVLGALLALGPFRRWGETVVAMPHYWLAKVVPGLAAGRYVAANLRLLYLGLSVLAALGAVRAGKLGHRALGGLLLLVAVGWIARPFAFDPLRHEPVYELIAADPAPGAVIDLPHDFRVNLRRMALGQILHRRPLGGGPVTRVRPEVRAAFERDLLPVPRFQSPPPPRAAGDPELLGEVAENERLLAENGFRFVIVRRLLLRDPEFSRNLRPYLAAHPHLTVREIDGHLLIRVESW